MPNAREILQRRRQQLQEGEYDLDAPQQTQPQQEVSARDLLSQRRQTIAHDQERASRRTPTGWARNLARAPVEGAAGAAGGIVEGAGLDIERARREMGFQPRALDDIPTVQRGRSIVEAGRDWADIDPDYEGTFALDAARGGGSLAAFAGLGVLGRGIGMGTAMARGQALSRGGQMTAQMAPAVTGAQFAGVSEAHHHVQQFMEEYPELAAEAGLDDESALEIATGAQPRVAGTVQVASVVSLLRPLTGTLPQQTVRRMLETGLNEFVVENMGAAIQNNLRQKYDPDHPLWDEITYRGETAGVGAAALALLMSPLRRRGANVSARGPSSTESVDEALLQALAEEGIDVSMEDLVGDQAVDLSALYEGEQGERVVDQVVARFGHDPDAATRMDPQGQQYGGLQAEAAGTVQPAQEPGSPQPFVAQQGLPGERQAPEARTGERQAGPRPTRQRVGGWKLGLEPVEGAPEGLAELRREMENMTLEDLNDLVLEKRQEASRLDQVDPEQAEATRWEIETALQVADERMERMPRRRRGLDLDAVSTQRDAIADQQFEEAPDAQAVRSHPRQPEAQGQVGQAGQEVGRPDLQQPSQTRTETGYPETLTEQAAARMGEQDAHADAEYRSMVERSQRPEEELWAEAGDRISDQPVPRRPQPLEDPRLQDEATRQDIESMAARAGRAEEGGRMLVDDQGRVSRTHHAPQEMWWPDRPKNVSERDMREGTRKALAGEKVNANERRAVLYLLELSEIADVTNDTVRVQMFQEEVDASVMELDYMQDQGELVLMDMLQSLEAEQAQFQAERAEYERFAGSRAGAAAGATGPDVAGRTAAGARGREGPAGADRRGTATGTAGRDTRADQDVAAAAQAERPELRLEAQTPEQLRAQEAEAQRREQEAERQRQREAADAEVDDFQLTGSDRAADATPGQMDLTDQTQAPTASEQSRPAQGQRSEPAQPEGAEADDYTPLTKSQKAARTTINRVVKPENADGYGTWAQGATMVDASLLGDGDLEISISIHQQKFAGPVTEHKFHDRKLRMSELEGHLSEEARLALEQFKYEAEQTLRDEDPKFSMRPVRERYESMAPFGLRKGERYKVRQIGVALQKRQRQKFGAIARDDRSTKAANRIAKWMADEILHELQNPEGSAVGWYSTKYQQALDSLGEVFPELVGTFDRSLPGVKKLQSRQNARDFLTALIAVTSDGQTASTNLSHAAESYDVFRRTGKLPDDVKFGGDRNASIQGNFAFLQKMLDTQGPRKMHQELLAEDKVSSFRQAATQRGEKFDTEYPADETLPYAALALGPKLGAFYANLMGSSGYLTMDLWWSRTFNRYRGQLIPRIPGLADSPTDDKGNKVGLARFKELLGEPDMSDEDALQATIPFERSYKQKGYKGGTEIEKAANTIYKAAYVQLQDSPFNISDRGFMIDAARRAQRSLKKQGHDLSTADIQAILWYYEKRLYAELGARESADESYEEVAPRIVAHHREHGGWRPKAGVSRADARRKAAQDRGASAGEPASPFNLYVAHNLSEANLRFANELGGLPAPSLAVARADTGFETFGEITLLADPALLQDAKAKTFDADVYSPRQPRPEYPIDYGRWRTFEESLGDRQGLRRPDMDAAERGPEEMARNPAVKLGFLREIGKAPGTKKRKASPELKKAAALGLSGPNEVRTDPRVQALAERFYRKDHQKSIEGLVEGGMSRSEAESLMEDTFFEEDGSLKRQMMQRFAMQVWSYQEDGGVDVAALEKAINKAMRPKLVQQRYENWVREKHNQMHSGPRMFRGFTQSGTRRYSPYTLRNVLREMVKTIQGGEGFNYGPGSIRARYANEIRSLREAQNRRDQIVTEEEMNRIREESGERVVEVIEKLKPYYRFDPEGFGYYDDASSAIAEGRRSWHETFDLDADAEQMIVDLVEYLRGLPTGYFEAKMGRAVDIGEFHTAVVPKDVRKDTVDLLKGKGLHVIKYNPDQDGARQEAIAQQEALLFSREHRNRPSVPHIGAREAQEAFGPIAEGLTSPVLVHETTAAAARAAGMDIPEGARGFFYQGKVNVIASAHTTLADAEGTLWHEILHAGVSRLFKGDTKAYMKAMNKLRMRNANLRRDAAEWERNYGDDLRVALRAAGITGEAAEARVKARALEEALADMSKAEGRAPKLQGLRELINTIVQFMRKHGFKALPDAIERMTDAEALHTIMAARQAVSEGGAQMLFGRPIGMKESRVKPKRDAMGFYSALTRAIQQTPTKLDGAKAGQWKSWLSSNAGKMGVKKEELEWSGVMEWLDLQEGPVAAEDVQNYLEQGGVRIEEVTLGDRGRYSVDELTLDEVMTTGGLWVINAPGQTFQISRRTYPTLEQAKEYIATTKERDDVDRFPAKFADWRIPGGGLETYREVLLTLPAKDTRSEMEREFAKLDARMREDGLFSEETARWEELGRMLGEEGRNSRNETPVYRSSHWDTPNVLAHIRVDDRTGANGERILFVHEIQSDWGQEGRKKGFGAEPNRFAEMDYTIGTNAAGSWEVRWSDGSLQSGYPSRQAAEWLAENMKKAPVHLRTPEAPFVQDTKSWVSLALKRTLVMAAEGGYDQVAFATGEQSAELYNLEKRIGELAYWRDEDGDFGLSAVTPDGTTIFDQHTVKEADLEGVVGKEVAKRMLDGEGVTDSTHGFPQEPGVTFLRGEGLRVEAKGMRDFYDKILPQAANKILKPLKGRVGRTQIVTENKAEISDDQFDVLVGIQDVRKLLRDIRQMRDEGSSQEEVAAEMRSAYPDVRGSDIDVAVAREFRTTQVMEQLSIQMTPELSGQITEEGLPLFSLRTRKPPKNTVKAYKLFEVRGGKLYPLFIGATQEVPFGQWLDADADNLVWAEGFRRPNGKKAWKLFRGDRNAQPTEGDFQTHELRIMAVGKGNQLFAPRPGWHLGASPSALHIGAKVPGVTPLSGKADAPTHRRPTQVWAEVEVAADVDWQAEANRRAGRYKSGPLKGQIKPKEAEIRDELPVDGFYRYKTNTNMEGDWIITGAMKVNRVLSQAEVDALNQEAGTQDLPRQQPLDLEALGLAESPKFSRDPSAKLSRPVLERQEKAQDAIAKGQPIDRVFRFLFDVTGSLDARGRFKSGVQLEHAFKKALIEWKPDPDGAFGWMNPMLAHARAGLIDRYGLDQEFLQREFESQAEASTIIGMGEKFLRQLAENNVGPTEARVLQRILNGEDVGDANMRQLAAPIRQAIDDLGQEMVSLNLLPAETYHKNLGQYLHRSYLKYETEQQGLPKWRQNIMRKHRRKIHGDELKARGLKEDVTTDRLLRDLPPDWWGRKLEKGQADKQLVNTEWKILDLVTVPGEGVGQLEGVDVTPSQPHTLRRVFWPADMPVPDRMSEYTDRGTWKVTGTRGGKLRLRRDFTKQERDAMGEVLDARYNILKTFQLMSHDIANGRFFQDIAKNPEWAVAQPPADAEIAKPSEARRFRTFAEADWVHVPDTSITGTAGVKQWGALAGMYVRPEIWRDLNEMDKMRTGGTWREILNQWKINKTARSPVVHMNNVMSNFVLMDLIDVRLQDLVRGIAEYRQGGELFVEARDNGAFGASFVRQELDRNFVGPLLDEILQQARDARDTVEGRTRFLSNMGYAVWDKIKKADRKMVDMYQLEDELFRMATFMRHRSMGASAQEAAMIAREQFLNYDIRAPWINAARRSVLPFISYTYRAVPAIAQAIMHRPWKLAKYITLGYLANMLAFELAPGDEDEERRTMREPLQGMTWASLPGTDIGVHRMIRMPWKDQHDNPVYLDVWRWMPAGDVFDTNQGQIGLPAWAQWGGPLQIAFELTLNRSAFTGRDIVDRDTDTFGQRLMSRGDYLWKAWMPSATYVPGSWHFDKAWSAFQDERDILGRPYSMPTALSSGFGVKLQPHDVQLGYYFRGNEIERKLRAVQREARQIERDAARNIGNPAQRRRDLNRVQQKIERLEEEYRALMGRS